MILAGSLEFERGHNNEIQERPSDNVELPEVRQPASFLSTFSVLIMITLLPYFYHKFSIYSLIDSEY